MNIARMIVPVESPALAGGLDFHHVAKEAEAEPPPLARGVARRVAVTADPPRSTPARAGRRLSELAFCGGVAVSLLLISPTCAPPHP